MAGSVYEQSLTDLVEVTDLPGGVSLLTFAWATRTDWRAVEAFYARTSEVDAIAVAHPDTVVTSLADAATRYVLVLRGADVPDIFTDVPWEIATDMRWREDGGLPSLFIDPAEAGTAVDPADLYTIDYSDHTFRSFVTGEPVTRALTVWHGVSAEDFDLPTAAGILAAHPWVTRVHYDAGLWTSSGHTPPSLVPIVVLPQEEYSRIHAAHGHVPGDTLTAVLAYAAKYPDDAGGRYTLGRDPLGLAAALRSDKYPWPDDDDDCATGGESFAGLAEAYPSIRDTYHVL